MNKRTVFASLIGQIIEWYDFTVYGFFASIMAINFFPSQNLFSSLIASLSVFAIGFFARPIGALFSSYYGDKVGRKKIFYLSIFAMGLPTLFIGLLPTYATANMAAPILLIILRIVQGFACGAEFIGSVIYLGEHVSSSKKTFWCSFAWVGSLSGTLLGLLVFTLLTGIMDQGDLEKWGWRIPFILGGFALFVAFWFRRHAQETPEFIACKNKKPNCFSAVSDIKVFKSEVIAIALMSIQIAVMTYYIIIFLPTYLNVFLNYPKKQAAQLSLAMAISILILTPVLSKIIDNAKIKHPIYYASLFNFLAAYPAVKLIETHEHFKLLLGLCVLILMCCSTITTFLPLFLKAAPVHVRFRVISIPYNVVISLFGGTLPLLMSYFIHTSNNISFPCYYLMFSSAISFYGSILLIMRIGLNKEK